MSVPTVISVIFATVKANLNDLGSVRWLESEAIRAFNDAQGAILIAAPDLFEFSFDVTLVAGVEQSLPTDGYLLFDVMWNVNNDGSEGRRITRVKKSLLDRHRQA